jgi:hypothetical protein
VLIKNCDSWNFLAKIDSLVSPDDVPVFWLDAHSDADDDDTFLREIDIIRGKYKRYVILIDDLKNPRVSNCSAQISKPQIIQTLNSLGARWPNYSETFRFQNQSLDLDTNPSCSSWCMLTTENIEHPLFDL